MPSSGSAGSARRPRAIRSRIGATPRVQDRAHVELDQLVDHELLGELGEQAGDLLERGLRPAARLEVEREVHAPGQRGRLGDAEGDHALDGELLEVRAAHAEQERQLAVVDRDLGDGGVDRPEPEREAGAVARAGHPCGSAGRGRSARSGGGGGAGIAGWWPCRGPSLVLVSMTIIPPRGFLAVSVERTLADRDPHPVDAARGRPAARAGRCGPRRAFAVRAGDRRACRARP